MSLADELLNDLDGLSDDEQAPDQTTDPSASTSKNDVMGPPALPSNGKRKADEDAEDDEEDDELDNALDGLGGGDSAKDGEDGDVGNAKMADGSSAAGYIGTGGTRPAEELDREEVEGMDLKDVDDVESVVKLHKSRKLLDALQVSEAHITTSTTLIQYALLFSAYRTLYRQPRRHLCRSGTSGREPGICVDRSVQQLERRG